MSGLIRFLIQDIVRHPGDVRINEVQGDASVLLELSVHPDDLRLVRGPDEETLRSIRTVLSAASGRRKVVLDLIDPADADADEDSGEDDGEDDATDEVDAAGAGDSDDPADAG